MKKVLSVVLAMLMVVSLATPSFAAALKFPVAKIQTVAGTEFSSNENFDGFPFNGVNPKFVFGAEMSVDSIGSDLFADFIADFEINFSEDVKAKLYGRFAGYEDGKWIEFPGEYIDFKKGNTDLLKTFAKDWQVTVSEIDTTVKNFYCALVVDPLTIDEEEFKVNVGVVTYEKEDPDYVIPVKTTADSKTEVVVEKPAAPMARIETVAGSAFSGKDGFGDFFFEFPFAAEKTECLLGAKFAVADLGEGYEKLLADFRINFSEAVRAKLYGKIEGGKWEEFSPDYIEFNEGDVDLLTEKAGDWKVTVSDVKDIDTFYCALLVDPSTVENAFTAKLNVITYADGEYAPEKVKVVEPTVDSVVEIALPGPTMPVAEIKTIAGTEFSTTKGFTDFPLSGLNEECLLGAEMSVDEKGFGFDNLIADFRINFSEDVKAKLYGKFEGENENWVALSSDYIDFKKGDIDLLHDLNKWKVSLADVKNIGTFYCALLLDPTTVESNFTAKLAVVTYEDGEYSETVDEVETTIDSETEAKLAKPEMPVATITMIPGEKFKDTAVFDKFNLKGINPDCVVGAIFEGTAGKGFEKFVADFKLKVSDDVTAKLYGNYGSYGWVLFNDGPVSFEGDKDYYLLKDFGDVEVDIKTVGSIGKFYCAFVVDEDSVDSLVDVSLGTVIYEKPADEAAEPKFIDVPVTSGSVVKYSVGKELVPPTADIKLIPGSEFENTEGFKDFAAEIASRNLGVDIDMDYVVGCVSSVADMGKGYNKSYVEYMLTLSEEVDALFFGKYRSFDWQEASKDFTPVSAGTTPILSKIGYDGSKMTLEQADELVGEFYCAFYIKPESAEKPVTVDFETILYEEAEEGVVYTDVKKTHESVTKVVTATEEALANVVFVPGSEFETTPGFTNFDITNIDSDYVVGATVKLIRANSDYNNFFIDFNIKTSKKVKAKLYGKIDNDWVAFDDSLIDFGTGDNYILASSKFSNVKVNECVGGTLYCVFVVEPDCVDNEVDVTLEPAIHKNAEAEYVSVKLNKTSENSGSVAKETSEPATLINESNCSDFSLTKSYKGYYAIENIEQLNWFATYINTTDNTAKAVLVDDIEATTAKITSESVVRSWKPIGSKTTPFEGVFDGKGHVISGLYVSGNDDYVGLIGYISNISAAIKDLGLENSYFEGNKYVGGIAGYNNGVIKTSYSFAEVKGNEYVGGICGYNNYLTDKCCSLGEDGDKAVGTNNGTANAYVKTEEQFKSGEAAYFLGNNWGQEIGIEDKPVFDGERVYNCGTLGFYNIPEIVENDEIDENDYTALVNISLGEIASTKGDLDKDGTIDVVDITIYERLMHHIVG